MIGSQITVAREDTMKRIIACALGALAFTATAAFAEYPEKEIQGIIQ